jgi:hypothetical protein
MIPLWQVFLNRLRPPGAIQNFSAAAYELQAAVNLRLALTLVEPTAECLARSQEVYACVEEYGELRESASTALFPESEKSLANALRLLAIEMKNCKSAAKARDIVAGLMLADSLSDTAPQISKDPADLARRHILDVENAI